MFIDTHCHLEKDDYESLDKIIENMDGNIMISSGADPKNNKHVIDMAVTNKNIFATIGIHPEFADSYTNDDLKFIEKNLCNPKVVGIGEIGLDYHYGKENKEKQKELFIKQIRLAKKYQLPITIHSRDAAEDTYEILKCEYDENLKITMHCYSYSLEYAKRLEKFNVMFGIGGVITFKNAKKLVDVVSYLPLEKILLETDSPYLAPEPYRGSKNEPKNSYLVAKKISEIKNESLEKVLRTTTYNAIYQFDLTL